MIIVPKRNNVVLYTSGVCNLNCRYCDIDKNPVLKDIDKALEDSFQDENYYFEQIKKYYPNRGQLQRLETWGGEPFLYIERIFPLLHKLINHYPYFNKMFSSTNFAFPNWTDKIFTLFNEFGKYPNREFTFELQLSVDGPEYINDAGRGKGTTEKCLKNFKKFCEMVGDSLPPNVRIEMALKQTLDLKNLLNLDTKEKIIEYYQFFEDNFIHPVRELGYENVLIGLTTPNIAVPVPATKEDGIKFASICKMCREIEEEDKVNNYFKYYGEITPFSDSSIYYSDLIYNYNYHMCGMGTSTLTFLPDEMYSICHTGFTHFIEDYKKKAKESQNHLNKTIKFNEYIDEQSAYYCLNEKDYNNFMEQMSLFDEEGTTARVATNAAIIAVMAMAGQIDSCYALHENALKASLFLQGHSSECFKDNYNMTGSVMLRDYGLLKMFFNGAMKYIQNDKEFKVEE